jgi:flagellar hook-associated protein 3 FlgL
MRELVVQAKNDTNNPENRQAIAKEIEQLKQDLVQTANTQVAGRYIFNGTKIDQAPVTYDNNGGTPTVNLDTNEFRIEVSKGITLQANIDGSKVFSQDLFNTVSDIHSALQDGQSSEQLDGLLKRLDDHLSNLSAERSELGARYNRLELIESRLGTQEVIANSVLSDNEDADIERVITDLKTQESVHRAALSVGARIIQPTLMDFLR